MELAPFEKNHPRRSAELPKLLLVRFRRGAWSPKVVIEVLMLVRRSHVTLIGTDSDRRPSSQRAATEAGVSADVSYARPATVRVTTRVRSSLSWRSRTH